MQAVVLVLMLLGIMAMTDTRVESRWAQSQYEGDAIALQLMAFHTQALRVCQNTPCGAGTVPVSSGIPGSSYVYGSDFVSVSNGMGMVVTTWFPREQSVSPRHLFGAVNEALRRHSMGQLNAGPWSAATQAITLGVIANNSWNPRPVNGVAGSSVTRAMPVPQGVGGLVLADQAPVIATQI